MMLILVLYRRTACTFVSPNIHMSEMSEYNVKIVTRTAQSFNYVTKIT